MILTEHELKAIIKEGVYRILESAGYSEARPAIYVGTYGKYNNGSLEGKWVYLDEFDSKNDFLRYCVYKLHANERDPELMFQDYEYIPEGFVGESFVSDKLWDLINLEGDWKFKYALADAIRDPERTIEILENGDYRVFWGCDSVEDIVYEMLDEGVMPAQPENYFDYERFGRDYSYDGPFNEESETIYDEFGIEEGDDQSLGELIIGQMYGGIENVPKETIERYMDVRKLARDYGYKHTFVEIDGGMVELF